VSINRVRAVMLGFLALLAVGSFGVSSASAVVEAGPFWHHRENSKEGVGAKIEANAPETFTGEGGLQKLKSAISGTNFTIQAKSAAASGIIYNNALQGQIKLVLNYKEPTLVEPALKPCEVKVGTNNEVKAEGHLAWKYRGVGTELTESPVKVQKPDIIFTPAQIKKGDTKLPEGKFTEVTLTGSGCGVLAGAHPVKGSVSVIPKPENLEEWSRELKTTFPGFKEQHWWNGTENRGEEIKLIFGTTEPATLTGEINTTTNKQEAAVFEK
jgi:hypothetical protein